MRDPYDLPSHYLEATRLAREALDPLDRLRAQVDVGGGLIRQVIEQARSDEALRLAMFPNQDLIEQVLRSGSEARQFGLRNMPTFEPSVMERAHEAIRLAEAMPLPVGIDPYRTSSDLLVDKWLHLPDQEWARRSNYISAFNVTSAISDLIAQSGRFDAELLEATRAFTTTPIPAFENLTAYRQFLDAAGLILPRWPQMRLLTAAEKRRRFKATLQRNGEPRHVKQAKSLVHRYELTLREIIDTAMAEAYGEDWAEQRLPLCNCKDLLGKWKTRGGEVLDHADNVHYARIMSHPDHFDAVFNTGFDDPEALADLMLRAGKLRAASHHARNFTQEDLRDLRLVWRTIETGLIPLTPDHETASWA